MWIIKHIDINDPLNANVLSEYDRRNHTNDEGKKVNHSHTQIHLVLERKKNVDWFFGILNLKLSVKFEDLDTKCLLAVASYSSL